ncbi:hypothetical protein ENH_00045460, partial [Eimeria necatrix]
MFFEQLNESWEVFFFENNKRSSKPFPVKKFGVAAAKQKATEFARQMQVQQQQQQQQQR